MANSLPNLKKLKGVTKLPNQTSKVLDVDTSAIKQSVEQVEKQNETLLKNAEAMGISEADIDKVSDERNFVQKFFNLKENTGIIGGTLELMNRPAEALQGLLSSTNLGEDPFKAVWAGFHGDKEYSLKDFGLDFDNPLLNAIANMAYEAGADPFNFIDLPMSTFLKKGKDIFSKTYKQVGTWLGRTPQGQQLFNAFTKQMNNLVLFFKKTFGTWSNDKAKDFMNFVSNVKGKQILDKNQLEEVVVEMMKTYEGLVQHVETNWFNFDAAEQRQLAKAFNLTGDFGARIGANAEEAVKLAARDELFNGVGQFLMDAIEKDYLHGYSVRNMLDNFLEDGVLELAAVSTKQVKGKSQSYKFLKEAMEAALRGDVRAQIYDIDDLIEVVPLTRERAHLGKTLKDGLGNPITTASIKDKPGFVIQPTDKGREVFKRYWSRIQRNSIVFKAFSTAKDFSQERVWLTTLAQNGKVVLDAKNRDARVFAANFADLYERMSGEKPYMVTRALENNQFELFFAPNKQEYDRYLDLEKQEKALIEYTKKSQKVLSRYDDLLAERDFLEANLETFNEDILNWLSTNSGLFETKGLQTEEASAVHKLRKQIYEDVYGPYETIIRSRATKQTFYDYVPAPQQANPQSFGIAFRSLKEWMDDYAVLGQKHNIKVLENVPGLSLDFSRVNAKGAELYVTARFDWTKITNANHRLNILSYAIQQDLIPMSKLESYGIKSFDDLTGVAAKKVLTDLLPSAKIVLSQFPGQTTGALIDLTEWITWKTPGPASTFDVLVQDLFGMMVNGKLTSTDTLDAMASQLAGLSAYDAIEKMLDTTLTFGKTEVDAKTGLLSTAKEVKGKDVVLQEAKELFKGRKDALKLLQDNDAMLQKLMKEHDIEKLKIIKDSRLDGIYYGEDLTYVGKKVRELRQEYSQNPDEFRQQLEETLEKIYKETDDLAYKITKLEERMTNNYKIWTLPSNKELAKFLDLGSWRNISAEMLEKLNKVIKGLDKEASLDFLYVVKDDFGNLRFLNEKPLLGVYAKLGVKEQKMLFKFWDNQLNYVKLKRQHQSLVDSLIEMNMVKEMNDYPEFIYSIDSIQRLKNEQIARWANGMTESFLTGRQSNLKTPEMQKQLDATQDLIKQNEAIIQQHKVKMTQNNTIMNHSLSVQKENQKQISGLDVQRKDLEVKLEKANKFLQDAQTEVATATSNLDKAKKAFKDYKIPTPKSQGLVVVTPKQAERSVKRHEELTKTHEHNMKQVEEQQKRVNKAIEEETKYAQREKQYQIDLANYEQRLAEYKLRTSNIHQQRRQWARLEKGKISDYDYYKRPEAGIETPGSVQIDEKGEVIAKHFKDTKEVKPTSQQNVQAVQEEYDAAIKKLDEDAKGTPRYNQDKTPTNIAALRVVEGELFKDLKAGKINRRTYTTRYNKIQKQIAEKEQILQQEKDALKEVYEERLYQTRKAYNADLAAQKEYVLKQKNYVERDAAPDKRALINGTPEDLYKITEEKLLADIEMHKKLIQENKDGVGTLVAQDTLKNIEEKLANLRKEGPAKFKEFYEKNLAKVAEWDEKIKVWDDELARIDDLIARDIKPLEKLPEAPKTLYNLPDEGIIKENLRSKYKDDASIIQDLIDEYNAGLDISLPDKFKLSIDDILDKQSNYYEQSKGAREKVWRQEIAAAVNGREKELQEIVKGLQARFDQAKFFKNKDLQAMLTPELNAAVKDLMDYRIAKQQILKDAWEPNLAAYRSKYDKIHEINKIWDERVNAKVDEDYLDEVEKLKQQQRDSTFWRRPTLSDFNLKVTDPLFQQVQSLKREKSSFIKNLNKELAGQKLPVIDEKFIDPTFKKDRKLAYTKDNPFSLDKKYQRKKAFLEYAKKSETKRLRKDLNRWEENLEEANKAYAKASKKVDKKKLTRKDKEYKDALNARNTATKRVEELKDLIKNWDKETLPSFEKTFEIADAKIQDMWDKEYSLIEQLSGFPSRKKVEYLKLEGGTVETYIAKTEANAAIADYSVRPEDVINEETIPNRATFDVVWKKYQEAKQPLYENYEKASKWLDEADEKFIPVNDEHNKLANQIKETKANIDKIKEFFTKGGTVEDYFFNARTWNAESYMPKHVDGNTTFTFTHEGQKNAFTDLLDSYIGEDGEMPGGFTYIKKGDTITIKDADGKSLNPDSDKGIDIISSVESLYENIRDFNAAREEGFLEDIAQVYSDYDEIVSDAFTEENLEELNKTLKELETKKAATDKKLAKLREEGYSSEFYNNRLDLFNNYSEFIELPYAQTLENLKQKIDNNPNFKFSQDNLTKIIDETRRRYVKDRSQKPKKPKAPKQRKGHYDRKAEEKLLEGLKKTAEKSKVALDNHVIKKATTFPKLRRVKAKSAFSGRSVLLTPKQVELNDAVSQAKTKHYDAKQKKKAQEDSVKNFTTQLEGIETNKAVYVKANEQIQKQVQDLIKQNEELTKSITELTDTNTKHHESVSRLNIDDNKPIIQGDTDVVGVTDDVNNNLNNSSYTPAPALSQADLSLKNVNYIKPLKKRIDMILELTNPNKSLKTIKPILKKLPDAIQKQVLDVVNLQQTTWYGIVRQFKENLGIDMSGWGLQGYIRHMFTPEQASLAAINYSLEGLHTGLASQVFGRNVKKLTANRNYQAGANQINKAFATELFNTNPIQATVVALDMTTDNFLLGNMFKGLLDYKLIVNANYVSKSLKAQDVKGVLTSRGLDEVGLTDLIERTQKELDAFAKVKNYTAHQVKQIEEKQKIISLATEYIELLNKHKNFVEANFPNELNKVSWEDNLKAKEKDLADLQEQLAFAKKHNDETSIQVLQDKIKESRKSLEELKNRKIVDDVPDEILTERLLLEEKLAKYIPELQKAQTKGFAGKNSWLADHPQFGPEWMWLTKDVMNEMKKSFEVFAHAGSKELVDKTTWGKEFNDIMELLDKGESFAIHQGALDFIQKYTKRITNPEAHQIWNALQRTIVAPFKKLSVLSIGFHVRNMLTNYSNAFLAGFNPLHLNQGMLQAHKNMKVFEEMIKDLNTALTTGRFKTADEQVMLIRTLFKDGLSIPELGINITGSKEKMNLWNEYMDLLSKGIIGNNMFNSEHLDLIAKARDAAFARETKLNVKSLNKTVNWLSDKIRQVSDISFKWSKYADDYAKIAMYKLLKDDPRYTKLLFNAEGKQIYTPETYVKFVLFDYNNLTHTEETVMKALFPFYTWTRKNLEFQLKNFVANNKRYRILHNAIQGWKQGMANQEEIPDYMDSYIPVWNENGKISYIKFSPAYRDIDEIFSGDGIVNALTPIIKTPLEMITGYDFFTHREFTPHGVMPGFGLGLNNLMRTFDVAINQLFRDYSPTWEDKKLAGVVGKKLLDFTTMAKNVFAFQESAKNDGLVNTILSFFPSVFSSSDIQQTLYFRAKDRQEEIKKAIQFYTKNN